MARTSEAAEHEWRVAMSGTFDVENYGDLLFPLLAEFELARRLGRLRLERFSYTEKTTPAWPYPVCSLAGLPLAADSLDGVVIGGGDLVRFDKDVAPGYRPPTAFMHHPTGYWLTPALVAIQNARPVVWNAVGVKGVIPAWAEGLMRLTLGLSSYVAVRDEGSRQRLLPFAGQAEIAVVPDTAFGLTALLDPRRPSAEFVRARATYGLEGRYIVVQAVPECRGFERFVRAHPDLFRDCKIVVLEIGPALRDDAERLCVGLPGVIRLPNWPAPLLLAELIGHAQAAVGVSLHLAITALVFGVPVFRPAARWYMGRGKYAILDAFATVATIPRSGAIERSWFTSRWGRTEPAPAVRATTQKLAQHWDCLAHALTTPRNRPLAAALLGQFWQALPRDLEGWPLFQGSRAAHLRMLAAAPLRSLRRRLPWRKESSL